VRILVTGGAGFIGSALVRELAARHEVIAFDDLSRGRWDRLDSAPAHGRLLGDIRDYEAVKHAMHGCDLVAHLAYRQGTQTFYEEPRTVLDVALGGILNVLRACEATGCGELLLVSSSEAYQVASEVPTPETIPLTVPDVLNPRYSYGGGKIASEIASLAWQRSGVLDRVIIARPHNIIGPDMGREHVVPEFAIRMNRLILEHPSGEIEFPIQGTGQETRSFCHILDCTEQLSLLMDCAPADGASIWHVGVMEEHTIEDVAHVVAEVYDRQIKVIPGKLPKGSPPRRLPDTSRVTMLRDDPAWSPVTFRDAVYSTVRWYQDHG
jgi:nucleoside-diphosphate-sugar epimerase